MDLVLRKLFLIALIPFCSIHAQIIEKVSIYGAIGGQVGLQSIIDKTGNRYTAVSYLSDFTIDSAGHNILISKYPENGPLSENWALAIIKYDSLGRYLFHYKMCSYARGTMLSQGIFRPFSGLIISCDINNNILISECIIGTDSIDLIHSNGTSFNRIYTPVNQDRTLVLLCKINENGIFQWSNTMLNKWRFSQTDSISPNYTRTCRSLTTDINGDITVNLDFYRMYNPYIDTLTLTNHNGINTPVYIVDKDLLLKFSSTGSLTYSITPFSLKINNYADVTEVLKSVSDGINKYTILKITLYSNDTFNAPTNLPLNTGVNLVLCKTDANDAILWAKHIGKGQTSTFISPYIGAEIVQDICMDYSAVRQELVLGLIFYESDFLFTHDASIQPPAAPEYHLWVAKLNPQGTIVWNKEYPDPIQKLVSITYNPTNNGLILVALAYSNVNLGNLTLLNFPGTNFRYFLTYFDTSNFCNGAQWLAKTSQLSTIIGFPFGSAFGIWGIGNPITDKKDRTYLTGYFIDSIAVNCFNYKKVIGGIVSGTDGFVMSVIPEHVTVIDTTACNKITSFSGKYQWDSSGNYKDTIMNMMGCDSILTINLIILQTKNTLDINSCKAYTSPSGKYYWNSSGTYLDTIPNAKGCDSVLTIKLTILQTKAQIDTTMCKNYLSPSGKYIYDSTGIYNDTLLNAKGCDSIVTIHYTKLTITKRVDTISCTAITSPSGNFTYDSTGVYMDTVPSIAGCDSIITIHYTRLSTQSTIVKYSCDTLISPSGKYIYTQSGNYTDTLQSFTNCDSVISIQLFILPLQITVTKSNDLSCDSPSAQLSIAGGSSFSWMPVTGLSDPSISNPIVKTDYKTVYHVIVNDTLGCSVEDSVEILVNKQETLKSLANVFTPNNDGMNDCLLIESIGQLKQVSLSIFNRWGILVFETSSLGDCWNGKDKDGNNVAAGVYFYILDGISECDTEVKQHGTIQLIR